MTVNATAFILMVSVNIECILYKHVRIYVFSEWTSMDPRPPCTALHQALGWEPVNS